MSLGGLRGEAPPLDTVEVKCTNEGGGEGYPEEMSSTGEVVVPLPLMKADTPAWSIECQDPALGSLDLIHQRAVRAVVVSIPM